ncbi:MAG: class I SAM-dependent methyltransferase [Desulfobacterales bacterium]|nr:class I SAM-dependent methyltransferase [Desulfobacterales bacterium]
MRGGDNNFPFTPLPPKRERDWVRGDISQKPKPALTQNPMPDFYQTNYKTYDQRTFTIDPSPFLNPVLEAIPSGASILDIGCASGRDLVWFKNKGFTVTGFEKSPGLAALARKNARCDVIEGDFETYDFSILSFDAVLSSGAFVHVPHARLPEVIKSISLALVQKGYFYISLKKGEGTKTDDTGRTFYLWQDADLRQIFDRTGFAVLNYQTSESVMNSRDVWLGYVLRLNR